MNELGLRTIPGYIGFELLETDLVSATYLAERESDGYPVVLQIIAEEFDDPETAAAFYDVYERVRQIGHPVLPAVWDVGRHDGALYSVTDAVEGRSLSSVLERNERLSLDTTLAVCSELADALDTLHAADVVHGAINPYTVWINDRERAPSAPWVTLRGFGISGMLARRTSTDQHAPPPADLLYIAPEQIRRHDVSARVDQYALACLVVHCLTGAPPFERATLNALVGAHLFAAPTGVDGTWGDLPGHLVSAVQRALSKDAIDRFSLCDGFATAIGGTRQRSWTWMIEDALSERMEAPAVASDPIGDPIADPTGPMPVTTGNSTTHHSTTAIHEDVTARVFAEVDWLPGGASSNTPRVASPEQLPRLSPAPRSAPRLSRQLLRWLVIVVASLITITLAVTLISRTADQRSAGDQQDTAQPPPPQVPQTVQVPTVHPEWQKTVGTQPISNLFDTGTALISSAGDVVSSYDHATGNTRWQTAIDSPVVEVIAIADVVVARSDDALYGLDLRTGRELWNSVDEAIAPAALAASTRSLYVVTARDSTSMAVHALAPATGRLKWSIDDLEATAPRTSAAYHPSRVGGKMLYVLNGSRLRAIDTSRRKVRWNTTLDRPESGSLTAMAKAVVVINADGQICRYRMQDGDAVWNRCATLRSAPGARAVVRIRHARVLVRSAREVAAVNFTSGIPLWRVTDQNGFQDPFAANSDTAFVAHANGAVEAIDHQHGVERWRSVPLGDITAMTASDDGVYIATADGELARFMTTPAPSPSTPPGGVQGDRGGRNSPRSGRAG